ncbi:hypothetical protein GCM10009835_38470 [Planosporangium flavigriseum]|uniref:Uncharacterized protein n=1 Tax=Planosporangium flavigriseum TaxID=373681 RepID=A0A8J3LMJ8_9ACTN|nr:hypothetical protein Pfl04_24880 [Planosporangium flavigriseum]
MEDAVGLDALMVVGHATSGAGRRRPDTRRSKFGLAGRLLVGAVIGVAAVGGTVALAHAASTRQAESIFVTPAAPPVPPQPQAPTGASSPDGILPPVTDQAGTAPSSDPYASPSDRGLTEASPTVDPGVHQDDGLYEPPVPQDPHSNG